MILRELAALDLRQNADGADQMLVHRIVMIHVELHHRHDAAELRNEAAEHAGLVHHAQNDFRIACLRSAVSRKIALACGSLHTLLRISGSDLRTSFSASG